MDSPGFAKANANFAIPAYPLSSKNENSSNWVEIGILIVDPPAGIEIGPLTIPSIVETSSINNLHSKDCRVAIELLVTAFSPLSFGLRASRFTVSDSGNDLPATLLASEIVSPTEKSVTFFLFNTDTPPMFTDEIEPMRNSTLRMELKSLRKEQP